MATRGLPPNATPREIADAVNQALAGKLNNDGTFTLTASVTTTTVTDPACGPNSVILYMPATANAAGAISTMHFAPAIGQFVITHASTATVDRTFSYCLFSG